MLITARPAGLIWEMWANTTERPWAFRTQGLDWVSNASLVRRFVLLGLFDDIFPRCAERILYRVACRYTKQAVRPDALIYEFSTRGAVYSIGTNCSDVNNSIVAAMYSNQAVMRVPYRISFTHSVTLSVC